MPSTGIYQEPSTPDRGEWVSLELLPLVATGTNPNNGPGFAARTINPRGKRWT